MQIDKEAESTILQIAMKAKARNKGSMPCIRSDRLSGDLFFKLSDMDSNCMGPAVHSKLCNDLNI